MGWFGYCTYCGDETQSMHHSYLVWAGVVKKKDADDIFGMMESGKTILNEGQRKIFAANWIKIWKKLKLPPNYWNESNALDVQMLAAIFVDNKMEMPIALYKQLELAIGYLLLEHPRDFDKPEYRRKSLRSFLKRAKELTK